jgi:phosphoglycolate phosphatase-like HAD superfamily hydrolase
MAVMPEKYNEIVISENIVILDGVVNILTKFQQNDIILGLVTGNLEEIARAKLKKIGVDRFFYFGGFGSDHMDRAHLARLAIQRAQENTNLANIGKIFLFGDAPQDMKAAKEAGATAIGVTTGTFSKEHLLTAGADKVFPSFEDTEKILKFILKRTN